jgi:hypothetical protein
VARALTEPALDRAARYSVTARPPAIFRQVTLNPDRQIVRSRARTHPGLVATGVTAPSAGLIQHGEPSDLAPPTGPDTAAMRVSRRSRWTDPAGGYNNIAATASRQAADVEPALCRVLRRQHALRLRPCFLPGALMPTGYRT